MKNKNPIGKRGSIVEGQKLTKAKGADLMHMYNISSIHFIDICYKKNCLNMNTPDRMTFTPENTTSKLIYFNKKREMGPLDQCKER